MAKHKILTKLLAHDLSAPAGGILTEADQAPWLMQEAIEVIGWSMQVKSYAGGPDVDGPSDAYGELSQASGQTRDGLLCGVRVGSECWADAITLAGGAFGNNFRTETAFLPSGEFISLHEADYLYLHVQTETPAGEAGRVNAQCIVFYRKA